MLYDLTIWPSLQNAEGKVSVTFDCWADKNSHPFLALTAHWIGNGSGLGMLQLKSGLVAFHYIPGSHTGAFIGRTLLHLLDRADITDRVCFHASNLCRESFCNTIITGNKMKWFTDENDQMTSLPVVKLLHDIKTHWDSVYFMINRLWILDQIPHAAQQSMSGESTPKLGSAVPAFETFIEEWKRLSNAVPHCTAYIRPGLAIADTYYKKMGKTKAYVVTMFVDPTIHMTWINEHWSLLNATEANQVIKDLVCELS
ncbi:hypothetical protein EDD17DRAFT_1500406 [Pisolithus thermaeus]|nr:hypothetical protein EDD17DRAFT_1500406 [Pisolithus thermaeus]